MKSALGLLLAASMLAAQNANDIPEAHVALAKTAAGEDYQNLFNFQCFGPGPGGTGQRARGSRDDKVAGGGCFHGDGSVSIYRGRRDIGRRHGLPAGVIED